MAIASTAPELTAIRRHQPQGGAAVGEDQQQCDDADGGQQQLGVDAVEDLVEVGVERRRSGHLHRESRRGVGDPVADVDDGLGLLGLGEVHVDGEHQRLAVRGLHQRGAVRALGRLLPFSATLRSARVLRVGPRHGRVVLPGGGTVGVGDAGAALVHHQDRGRGGAGKLVLQLDDLGRFRAGREEVHGTVPLHVPHLPGQRDREERQDQPGADHGPLAPAAGRDSDQLPHVHTEHLSQARSRARRGVALTDV
ncbi:hypothetical protein RKD33_003199 [Streptomyces sp. SAI-129]